MSVQVALELNSLMAVGMTVRAMSIADAWRGVHYQELMDNMEVSTVKCVVEDGFHSHLAPGNGHLIQCSPSYTMVTYHVKKKKKIDH